MRQTAIQMVHELAKRDPRVLFLGSDLGPGILEAMRLEFPERYFMEGVSEANFIGMSAGLAMEGYIPYLNTIAPFFTRRAYEQIAVDLCLHHLPVRMLSSGGGLVYAPLGPTHLATEDIAILRALPRMTILAPADATEMRRMMPLTVDHPGPIYIRLGKGGDPIVTNDEPFAIGKIFPMRAGRDAVIISTGVMLKRALDASEALRVKGMEAAVLHCPTVKPLDETVIRAHAAQVPVIVTVEEHTTVGGLGSAVAEIIAEAGLAGGKRFRRIGIPDVFPDQYGSQDSLLARYDITAERIASTVAELAS